MYFFDGKMVVRDDGYIAVQHRNSNPTNHRVRDDDHDTYYVFQPRKNVSMAWVAPEHIDNVMAEMARICCGKKSKKFLLASLINVNLWTYGTREG